MDADGAVGAQMIYTSGTTGKPKGALRSRTDAALTGALLVELDHLHADGVHLTTGPLYHSGPLAFATVAWQLGHLLVVLRRFDASAWVRLDRVAPELALWSAYFAAGSAKRQAAEAGITRGISPEVALEMVRQAAAFVDLAEVRLRAAA